MRILTGIDVPFQPFGGSLLVCDDWYSDLPEDVEVRFLTLPPPEGTRKWWRMKDVVFLDIEKVRGVEGFEAYTKQLATLVQQQIDDFKPDIIHCQHLNFGLSRVFSTLRTDIPRLGICHGTDVQSAIEEPFFSANLRIISDAMDSLVFPNQTMANDFLKLYDRRTPYIINPLGIPDKYFHAPAAPPSHTAGRPLRVLYAGRLLKWKGADIAVKALALMKEAARLTIIGNEDQKGYIAEITRNVRKHNLESRVTLKSQLPRDELLTAFAEYDVIVFPSIGLEAFSLTVIEAQIRGLPVIAAPGGGITETVGDGGIILADHTPGGLAAALDTVASRPELLQTLQKKGRENAARYRLSESRRKLLELSYELCHLNRIGKIHNSKTVSM